MKVVHVYKDFDPPVHGGIERHVALMCRHQRAWGEVSALTCSRSWRTRLMERDGTSVMEVGEWGRFQSAPLSPTFPWHMRRTRADVVVLHTPYPTGEVGYLLARPSGRLVVRYHSDIVRQARALRLYKPVLMNFLNKADMIIPTSRQYLESSPLLKSVAEKCHVVPLGVEVETFGEHDPGTVASLRERYGGSFVFFCGRHRYYKGLQYLIEAASEIRARIVIAGDGPERSRLTEQARKTDAPITFLGGLSDGELIQHLHAASVVAFPSVERSEAFGIGILEAHACGTPVVATRLGTGVEFANQDGVTGINVPPRDPHALAQALNTLLEDEALRKQMGETAQARVRSDFDIRRVARHEWDLYRKAGE